MTPRAPGADRPAPTELLDFLAAFPAPITPLFLAARTRLLADAPRANEFVYDAYNAVSAAYTFSDRLREAFCHLAAYSTHVNLGFNHGAELDDPHGLLQGKGTSIRHVRLRTADDLHQPGVAELIDAAVAQGRARVQTLPRTPSSVIKPTTGSRRRP